MRLLRKLKQIALLLVLSVLAPLPAAVGQEAPGKNYPIIAREMMHSLYPELSRTAKLVYRDDSSWFSSAPMNMFGMEIYEVPRCCFGGVIEGAKPAPPPDESWRTNPSVVAQFDFGVSAHSTQSGLLYLSVYGPHVTKRNDEFLRKVVAHPQWSESQIFEELSNAGAKFGPGKKTELLKSLPLKQLERFLGKLQVSSAVFVAKDLREQRPEFWWRVEATAHDQGTDDARRYVLDFEPFDGRLLGISRY